MLYSFYRRQSHQFDDFDDYNRFDDYDYDYEYQEDDYYNSDRQEMIFDTSADEWVPIWWYVFQSATKTRHFHDYMYFSWNKRCFCKLNEFLSQMWQSVKHIIISQLQFRFAWIILSVIIIMLSNKLPFKYVSLYQTFTKFRETVQLDLR